jgi:hypothetical protein
MFRFANSSLSTCARRLPLLAAIAIAFLLAGLSQRAAAFDQVQRFTSLVVQFGTDSFATNNRFGGAFTSAGQSQLNAPLQTAINNGTLSILFEMPGLTNFAGINQPSLSLGLDYSSPVLAPGYSATSDLDWWYSPNLSGLDTNGVPTNQLAASITASVLNSSGGRFSLTPSLLNLNGGGRIDVSTVVLQVAVGLSKAVTESTNGLPPGHLPAENISPGFESFASMSGGKLRGNISAASLAATPIPASLVGNGSGYAATNTLLDVLVGGYLEEGIITVIQPTQPDQSDPAAPVAGAGPPYKFLTTGKSVTGAEDKNGSAVSLSAALNAAAYSSYFTFGTGRVIAPPPALLSISYSAGGVNVSWLNLLTGWTLQTNGSLTSPNWGNYPGVSGTSATINPPPARPLFFRLEY